MTESPNPVGDFELVALARRGDLGAFEELVVGARSRVYGLAIRMMKNTADAEEVVQDSFLAAWRSLTSLREGAAFGAWVCRICANLCLVRLRRVRLEHRKDEEARLPGPRSSSRCVAESADEWARGAEAMALDQELRLAIERATAAVPDQYRAVFLLSDVEGLSYQEIAAAVGATPTAVKSRLHRARLALREAIGAFYREPRLATAGL